MPRLRDRFNAFFLNLTRHIFIGFGVVLSIYAAQAIITNLGFNRAVQQFAAYDQLNQGAMRILNIERNVIALQHSVLAYTYTGYEGVTERVRRLQKELRGELDQVRESLDDPTLVNIWNRMDGHFTGYLVNFAAVIEERQSHDALLKRYRDLGAQADDHLGELMAMAVDARRDPALAFRLAAIEKIVLQIDLSINRLIEQPDTRLIRNTEELLSGFSALVDRLIYQSTDSVLRASAERIAALAFEYRLVFAGMVRATRGYMNLVNVVMAGEAAEFAYLAADLRRRTLEQLERIRATMQSGVNRAQTFNLWVSALAAVLATALAGFIARNLDRKTQELADANRYKSEFLANMSHELRTPLNSILILSKLLAANAHGNLRADQVESAEVIHASGADLLKLINATLDFSKIEAGRMEVALETAALAPFIRQLERQFQPVARHRDLEWRVIAEEPLPATVTTDWQKLQQILANLLANACKFTERGVVTLRVFQPDPRTTCLLQTPLAGQPALAFAVSDTGIGIPEHRRKVIFEAFRQADGATSRKYGGTGLGLSISQQLARMIGGMIDLESQEGTGSAFTVYLPLNVRPDLTAPANSASRDEPPAPPLPTLAVPTPADWMLQRVLIVDDDLRNIFSLTRLLKPWVANILVAQNGRKALESLEQHPHDVDVVFMDIMMPEMDGYQATAAIRAQSRFDRLPILVMTAKTSSTDRERCIRLGANDFLSKPVDADELLAALRNLTGGNSQPESA